jgi:hypothetical protein
VAPSADPHRRRPSPEESPDGTGSYKFPSRPASKSDNISESLYEDVGLFDVGAPVYEMRPDRGVPWTQGAGGPVPVRPGKDDVWWTPHARLCEVLPSYTHVLEEGRIGRRGRLRRNRERGQAGTRPESPGWHPSAGVR